MTTIVEIFDWIQGLGVQVMMPIIIFILGLAFRAGIGRSLRSGLTVGIGFIGLNLVISELMSTSLGPAVQEMIARYSLELSTIDIGWPSTAAISFGSTVGIIIIPVGLLVNIVMLLTNTTQTVNVDIWDYWHFAFSGALAAILTNSVAVGVTIAIINMVIIMVIADITAPYVEESLDLPGVSLPHGFTAAYAPIALLFNRIIDWIPGIRDIRINTDTLQERFGVFGESMILGAILGAIIGIVAGYNITGVLQLSVSLAAVLVLIPEMAAMLMEGLLPVSDAASEFIQENFKERGKVYIGLDSAIGVGHPTTMAISLILVPLVVFLAVILPGNKVMPFADLTTIPWMFVLITPIVANNGFRALIIGLISLVGGLYIATDLAPLFTQAAANVGFSIPEGAKSVSSIVDGANPLSWILVRISNFGIVGLVILGAIALGMAVWNRRRIIREAQDIE